MKKELKTAILFFQPKTKRPRKYRNISDAVKFGLWAAKQGAWYINWYDPQTKKFERRTWLVSDFKKNH